MTEGKATRQDGTNEAQRLGLIGLLVVQIFVGYEWFMSGLTKIVRGGFASGLAEELREKSTGAVGWYKSFVDGTVIPNGKAFGLLIEFGELAIGVALVVAAVLWLARWPRLSERARSGVLLAIVLASIGAIFMNVNFHLANGSPHPWLIPKDGFDEGVDLDSLLPLIEFVFVFVAGALLVHRKQQGKVSERDQPQEDPARAQPTG